MLQPGAVASERSNKRLKLTRLVAARCASPGRFLLGVLVTKVGTAFGFVTLFAVSRAIWSRRWILYAMLWFVMFVFGEFGEVVSGRWTMLDAVLGVASEAVYFPVSAFITQRLLGRDTA